MTKLRAAVLAGLLVSGLGTDLSAALPEANPGTNLTAPASLTLAYYRRRYYSSYHNNYYPRGYHRPYRYAYPRRRYYGYQSPYQYYPRYYGYYGSRYYWPSSGVSFSIGF